MNLKNLLIGGAVAVGGFLAVKTFLGKKKKPDMLVMSIKKKAKDVADKVKDEYEVDISGGGGGSGGTASGGTDSVTGGTTEAIKKTEEKVKEILEEEQPKTIEEYSPSLREIQQKLGRQYRDQGQAMENFFGAGPEGPAGPEPAIPI